MAWDSHWASVIDEDREAQGAWTAAVFQGTELNQPRQRPRGQSCMSGSWDPPPHP